MESTANPPINDVLCSLGSFVDGVYMANDDCFLNLALILRNLAMEDTMLRTYRRAISFGQNIKKDFVPLLIYAKDPDILDLTIRLLANLTMQPECLLPIRWIYELEIRQHAIFELNQLVMTSKEAFADWKVTKVVFDYLKFVLKQNSKLSIQACDTIVYCLVLFRNILDFCATNNASLQNQILWNMFTQRVDCLLMYLMTVSQRAIFAVPIAQLMTVMYKNQNIKTLMSFWNEFTQSKSFEVYESDTSPQKPNSGTYSPNTPPSSFKTPTSPKQNNNADNKQKNSTTLPNKKQIFREKLIKWSMDNIITTKEQRNHIPTDDDISNILKKFTVIFMLKGYGILVQELHAQLLTDREEQIDKANFFWLIMYFLNFACQVELDIELIKRVLSYDIISYLTYNGVMLCEQVEQFMQISQVGAKPYSMRLHWVITAIHKILQAIEKYKNCTHLSKEDQEMLTKLQLQISSSDDLKNLFVLLLRRYNPSLQSKQYLKHLIVTNHSLMLLLDGINDIPGDNAIDMELHLRQFATVEIMHHYGLMLESFQDNEKYVNDIIFLMMNHVVAALGLVHVLLQSNILKTFFLIKDSKFDVCDNWNDLIEYVIFKHINNLQTNSITLKISLTRDDKNLLRWYKAQCNKSKRKVSKILQLKEEIEYNKLKEQDKLKQTSTKSDELGNKNRSSSKVVDDVQILRDRLLKENKGKFVVWLQKILLDCCFVKINLLCETSMTMEPVPYHCILQNKSIPIVPWNLEQCNIFSYQLFVRLLQKLGFCMPADSFKMFVRIPEFWTLEILYNTALKLGPLEKSIIKFDLNDFNKALSIEKQTKNDFYPGPEEVDKTILNCFRGVHLEVTLRLLKRKEQGGVMESTANPPINDVLCSLGSFVDGVYMANDDCFLNLALILRNLAMEDTMLRTYRRAISFGQNIKKDFVPLLIYAKDPDILDLTIRLLANLTMQPECLLPIRWIYELEIRQHAIFELNQLVMTSKEAFADWKVTKVVFDYLKFVLKQNSKLSIQACDTIVYCLVLFRNILDFCATNNASLQNQILWNMFTQRVDCLLMYLMTVSQRAIFAVPIAQLMTVMYKNQNIKTLMSFWNEFTQSKSFEVYESDTSPQKPNSGTYSPNTPPSSFKTPTSPKQNNNADNKQKNSTTLPNKKQIFREKLIKWSMDNIITTKEQRNHIPTDDDISNILKKFTVIFMLKGYGILVQELHAQLLTDREEQIDKANFFWLIMYFLNFACQVELDIELIKRVLSYDIISYLTYNGVMLCEQVEQFMQISQVAAKPYSMRLHWVITAIHEILQAIEKYKNCTHLSKEDQEMLTKLQLQISSSDDLKNLFVLLLRRYNPSLQSKQYLKHLIVTNHSLMLLLDGINDIPGDNAIDMELHLRQFATVEIMHHYGLMLESFQDNEKYVNDIIFLMMNHVVAALGLVHVLLQSNILKTFFLIKDSKFDVCDNWNDLIEYVIFKHINNLQTNSITLKISLTRDDKNLLRWYKAQCNKSKRKVSKILQLKEEIEYNKLKEQDNLKQTSTKSDELGNKNRSSSKVVDDVQILRDRLLKENKGKFVVWLQKILLDCCFVKINLLCETSMTMEPVPYHCILQNKSIPIVPWNLEQCNIFSYQLFVRLLQKLGFCILADLFKLFVRIPEFWTLEILYNTALKLGPLEKSIIKFDLNDFNKALSIEKQTKNDFYPGPEEVDMSEIKRSFGGLC